jgi:hypothetical protein
MSYKQRVSSAAENNNNMGQQEPVKLSYCSHVAATA